MRHLQPEIPAYMSAKRGSLSWENMASDLSMGFPGSWTVPPTLGTETCNTQQGEERSEPDGRGWRWEDVGGASCDSYLGEVVRSQAVSLVHLHLRLLLLLQLPVNTTDSNETPESASTSEAIQCTVILQFHPILFKSTADQASHTMPMKALGVHLGCINMHISTKRQPANQSL